MDFERLKGKIVRWLREKANKAGATGGVVGLSGGIDSTLVAYLSKEAYGEGFLPLFLPCQSKKADFEDAKLVEEFLGMKAEVVDLNPIYNTLCSIFPGGTKISQANLKPRLRMLTLYYFANTYNKLVVGTGNKSELMLGYFTKYGDGGVDILPLGDLYKTQVRELARYLGVPEKILNKPPSAGLWEGQTDEGEIGLSYEEVDRILKAIEKSEDLSNFSQKSVRKVREMMERSSHKLKMPEVFKVPI
jgi:NAD+ synthase